MAEASSHAAPQRPMQQQLPHGVLECLCSSATPRQRAALSAVCKGWRDTVLLSTTRLSVNLKSDTGADSITQWLQQHAGQLQALELSTVDLYSRHIHPPTRLRLFQALHAAAGSTAAEHLGAAAAGAAGTAGAAAVASVSEEEEELQTEQQQQQQQQQGPAEPQGSSACQLHKAAAAAAASPASGRAATAAASATQHDHQQQQPTQVKPLRLTHLAVNARLAVLDCAAIASLPAPQLASLALLGSRTRRLGFDGVGSLAQLRQLTSLKVERLGIGDDATVMLARSLTQLLQLSLSGNNIGPGGAAGIARHLVRLQQLDLSVNRIKDAGLASLCSSLHHLDSLNLSGNLKFAPPTLQQLQCLVNLTSLQASTAGLSNQGLAALANGLQGAPLRVLDAAGNKISKVDAITALTGLTSLTLSRNPLQLASSKVLASSLPHLQELVLFDAVSAKAVGALAGLAHSLTCLTLGCDPGVTADDTPNLPLSKSRTCSALFSVFAGAGKLQVLAVPCAGLGDAQGKMLARFGPGQAGTPGRTSLVALNLSYNRLSAEGLGFLKELPQLLRLEVRAMRPELTDVAAKALVRCSRLELLDLAFNDLSSDGVRQLGSGQLQRLRHLNLRSNVQVEKSAVIAAAGGLSALTYLNLLELSDVSSRPGAAAAAAATGSAARAGARGSAAGSALGAKVEACAVGGTGGAALLHADVWAALPNLQELVVGTYSQGGSAFRSGRLMISCGS